MPPLRGGGCRARFPTPRKQQERNVAGLGAGSFRGTGWPTTQPDQIERLATPLLHLPDFSTEVVWLRCAPAMHIALAYGEIHLQISIHLTVVILALSWMLRRR